MLAKCVLSSRVYSTSDVRMKLTIGLVVLLLTVGPCVGCTSGSLRLTGTSSGVLQICKNNEWRIVCSEDWGHVDAAVACRQLGYDGGYTQSTWSSNAEGITVDPVEYHCSGRENNLQACDNQTNSRCSNRDVATIACVRRNASDPCSSGDIRLWGGEREYEGNIEMCTDHGVWSAVCDSSWGTADATVACRQLNYTNSISLIYRGSTIGQRIQPMEYGGLSCRGTESSLQQCAVSSTFVRTFSRLFFCNERDYAGVRCIPRTRVTCRNGAVRLKGGYSPTNGLAEICLDGVWIGICLQSSPEISMHICKQLGYPRYTRIDQNFFTANRSEPQAYVSSFREYQCRSESSVLLDCVYNSTTYGISYTTTCTPHGVLCCTNDTASCCFQQITSDDPTTPPTMSTPTTSPTNSTAITPPTSEDIDAALFSLHFESAATSLIMAFSRDLRGLEEDIKERVVGGISEECDCLFDTSALQDGSFSLGQHVTYSALVHTTGAPSATSLVTMLKASIEKGPVIYFRGADLYLDVQFDYVAN